MSENINDSDKAIGRGRPIGSGGRSSSFTHYNPKRWQPEFDLIVIESVSGKSNEEIGRIYGYTKEHISNILSTAKAQEIKEGIRDKINKNYEGTLKERMASIGAKTIEKIEKFMEDENDMATRSPFNFIDRVLAISKAVGSTNVNSERNGNVTNIAGNVIVVSNEKANDMMRALDRSAELEGVEYEVISNEKVS